MYRHTTSRIVTKSSVAALSLGGLFACDALVVSHIKTAAEEGILAARALALKVSVLRSLEGGQAKYLRDLQQDADDLTCFNTTDGGQKCCYDDNNLCLTIWGCDVTFEANCTCELEFGGQACEGCLLCEEGLGFDCSGVLGPGVEDPTCQESTNATTTTTTAEPTTTTTTSASSSGNETEHRANECHPTNDGNYECCDYSTGTPVCMTLELSVKPAGTSTGNSEACSPVDSNSYDICIDTESSGTHAIDWTRFTSKAKNKWESVIVGDLAAGDIRTPEYPPEFTCGPLPAVVDDLYICLKEPVIDGPGGVLGGATPIFVRTEGGLPISGYMQFDSADIQYMVESGSLEHVLLHEMGHVLGFGSLLQVADLVTNEGTESAPEYAYKNGTKACQMWQDITGCGGCPPVESEHGNGTAGVHWDETVMGSELMTGFNEEPGTPMPLSKITVGALEDLGYVVDYTKADNYDAAPQCNEARRRRGLRRGVRYLGEKTAGRHNHHHRHKHDDDLGTKRRKELSIVGRAVATEYGKQMLAKAHANRPKEYPAGLVYIADRFASVLVEDGGSIFSVDLFDNNIDTLA